jgi:hypothetical protein
VSWWSEYEYSGFVKVSFQSAIWTLLLVRDANRTRFRGARVSNHAAAAKLNVFKHMMVLTDGMALKAVILGSLALAFLA